MKAGIYTALFLISISKLCDAQPNYEFTRVNEFYSFITLEVSANELVHINENIKYTSLKIELEQPYENPIHIGYRNNEGILKYLSTTISEHSDESINESNSSSLQVFHLPQNEINIDFGEYKGHAKIILLYAPPLSNATLQRLNKTTGSCDKPQMISYVVWREFLPNPKPPREATDVEHLVVHHSAGNNADTNYVEIVRNIYLLHTQTNGWDDIGYNFLIAPNGVVFKGRDPQGVADDDDILGAHFCGKNQNTMGVCVMGDFMTVRPTPQALFSLKYLLAWKLKKDSINGFGQTKHPRETGTFLNNICGHRNGCNTLCPGDSLYLLLPSIKMEAARIADSCGLVLSDINFASSEAIHIYPNPSNGSITIGTSARLLNPRILIYGIAGNLINETSFEPNKSFDLDMPADIYFYKIIDKESLIYNGRFIVIEE